MDDSIGGIYFHIIHPPSMIQSYRVNPHITDNCYPRETRTYIDSQNPIPIVRTLLYLLNEISILFTVKIVISQNSHKKSDCFLLGITSLIIFSKTILLVI